MSQHLSVIEDNQYNEGYCPCCGHEIRLFTGYVRNEIQEIAQYFVYSVVNDESHAKNVDLIVGNISTIAKPIERFAVSIQYFPGIEKYSFIDPDNRPFGAKRHHSSTISRPTELAEEFSAHCNSLASLILEKDSRVHGG